MARGTRRYSQKKGVTLKKISSNDVFRPVSDATETQAQCSTPLFKNSSS